MSEKAAVSGKPLRARVGLRLWLETDDGVLVGPGRVELLRKVDELGSIKKAAEAMSMSYRAAWGKIKKTEDVLGEKIVSPRGSNRRGCGLTDAGRALLSGFLALQSEVLANARESAATAFSWVEKP